MDIKSRIEVLMMMGMSKKKATERAIEEYGYVQEYKSCSKRIVIKSEKNNNDEIWGTFYNVIL